MGFIRFFTSFSGRVGRGGFWGGMILLLLLGGAATFTALEVFFADNPVNAVREMMQNMGQKELVIALLLLWPLSALIIKRLHDRNKSGILAALIWAPAVIKIFEGFTGNGFVSNYLIGWGMDLLTAELAAVGLWFFIELGFYGGTRGVNKYGPDPRDD